jgi:hypothetical protein
MKIQQILKFNFNLLLNSAIILSFLSYKNYLEENLIIGVCTYIILFIVFFIIRELKEESIKEFRRKIKSIFFIQNEYIKCYSFLSFLLFRRCIRFKKRILYKKFFTKVFNLMSIFKLKNLFFFLKIFTIKLANLNILINLVLFKLNMKVILT